jgi:limonene-1,2-epoxide hydrolase
MALAFRKAVEMGDLDGAIASLAPGVVLHSPVTFKPFQGKEAVAALLSILFRTFEDFRYVAQFEGDGGTVLHFRTRVGDREVEGIDMMVRPLSAALALRDSVGAQLGATP